MAAAELLLKIIGVCSGFVALVAASLKLWWDMVDRREQQRAPAPSSSPRLVLPPGTSERAHSATARKRKFVKPVIVSSVSILVAVLLVAGIAQTVDDDEPAEWPPTIVDRFADSAENWTTINDATVEYQPTGGHPGGYVSATDILGKFTTWYWEAPSKYLGDKAAYTGKTLTFDLRQSSNSEDFAAADVWLLGPKDLALVYDAETPGTDWTSYRVRLDGGIGWHKVDTRANVPATTIPTTSIPATLDDMREVLSNLTHLRIRGEYANLLDVGGLDNVVFGA